MTDPARKAECPRIPVPNVAPADPEASLTTLELRAIGKLLATAYPGLALYFDATDSTTYVLEDGQAYRAAVDFERDKDSGYGALVLSYPSQQEAAARAAAQMTGAGCRATTELIVARSTDGATWSIVARAPLDDEAVAVDVRTIDIDNDYEGVSIRLLYFAYYGMEGAHGHVGFRSKIAVDGTKLVASRLPASYQKVTRGDRIRQEGAMGPGGGGGSSIRLLLAPFDTNKEEYLEIEVPLVGDGWMSGVEILRRIPPSGRARVAEPASAPRGEPPTLLGCWRLAGGVGIDTKQPLEFDFLSAEEADYAVELGSGWFVRRIRYWLEGDVLVIKATSATPEERHRYVFEPDGSLVLSSERGTARFVRGERRAPAEAIPWR